MELDEVQLREVPNAGVLHELSNGIQIIRRRKHEPIDLPRREKELARQTNKCNGSKFLPETTLTRIVEMTSEVLLENRAEIGSNDCYNKVYDEPIGISAGRRVKGLRVCRSNRGRYAHAYPQDEAGI